MLSQATRKLVIRVGRDLSPSNTVLRDKHRKMLEKVYMASEDLGMKPEKISRCKSINWMHAMTALQKQLNKKQHREHIPGLPAVAVGSRPWRDISWCPHPSLTHGITGQRHLGNLQQDRKTGWNVCRTDCPFYPKKF